MCAFAMAHKSLQSFVLAHETCVLQFLLPWYAMACPLEQVAEMAEVALPPLEQVAEAEVAPSPLDQVADMAKVAPPKVRKSVKADIGTPKHYRAAASDIEISFNICFH